MREFGIKGTAISLSLQAYKNYKNAQPGSKDMNCARRVVFPTVVIAHNQRHYFDGTSCIFIFGLACANLVSKERQCLCLYEHIKIIKMRTRFKRYELRKKGRLPDNFIGHSLLMRFDLNFPQKLSLISLPLKKINNKN